LSLRGKAWRLWVTPTTVLGDFHPFGHVKKHLADKWLSANANVKQALTSWLQTFEPLFSAGIQALVVWWGGTNAYM